MLQATELKSLKPFFSIFIFIATLFSMMFLQMEERRMGYELLKISKEHRGLEQEKRQIMLEITKATRPQYVEHIAQSRMTLKKAKAHQIIQLSGSAVVRGER